MTPLRITTLCSKLVLWTDDQIPSQRQVYYAAVGARIPAHQLNAIWHFFEEDREAILKGLGLQPKAAQPGHEPHSAAIEHASAA